MLDRFIAELSPEAMIIILIIDYFCIVLFCGEHKLSALYNISNTF